LPPVPPLDSPLVYVGHLDIASSYNTIDYKYKCARRPQDKIPLTDFRTWVSEEDRNNIYIK